MVVAAPSARAFPDRSSHRHQQEIPLLTQFSNRFPRRKQRQWSATTIENHGLRIDAQETINRRHKIVRVKRSLDRVFPLLIGLSNDLPHIPSTP